jgi:hypothetical protein
MRVHFVEGYFRPDSDVLICTFAAKKIAAVDVSLRRHLGPLPADTFGPRHGAPFFNDLPADCRVHLTGLPFGPLPANSRMLTYICYTHLAGLTHLF